MSPAIQPAHALPDGSESGAWESNSIRRGPHRAPGPSWASSPCGGEHPGSTAPRKNDSKTHVIFESILRRLCSSHDRNFYHIATSSAEREADLSMKPDHLKLVKSTLMRPVASERITKISQSLLI